MMDKLNDILSLLACGFVGFLLGAVLSECPDCKLNCDLKCPEEPLQELSELIDMASDFYTTNPWTENYMCLNQSKDFANILNKLGWNATVLVGRRELENGTRKGHAWVNIRTAVNGTNLDIQFGGSRARYPLLYSIETEKDFTKLE